jgi:tetratricopeptide (TPR) repeat protein
MVPEQDPSFGDAMMIAAEAASRQTALDRAEQAYQAAVRAGCSDPMLARFCLADVQMHAGNLSASIAGFRSILQQEPGDVATHSRLAYLYAATGRRWECRPHLEAVLKSGAATLNELVLLADLERPVQNESFLRSCAEAYPRDENVRLGLAAIAVENGDVAQAISELLALTREQPSLLSAHVLLGELLANERSRRFEDWHRTLPDSADTWPGIWFVRGLRALTWEDRGMAARCFGSAIQLAPAHRRANYQMGRVLTDLEDPAAGLFAERARELFRLSQQLHEANRTQGQSEAVIRDIVGLLDGMGRVWETCAWAQWARTRFPRAAWATQCLQRLSPELSDQLPMFRADSQLLQSIDLAGLPPFQIQSDADTSVVSTGGATKHEPAIRFELASDAGVTFQYQNAADLTTPGARMQEQTGGGVAVIDIDRDQWPDLYFVQGAPWPSSSARRIPSPDLTDRIYRNQRGTGYGDVTELVSAPVHRLRSVRGCWRCE